MPTLYSWFDWLRDTVPPDQAVMVLRVLLAGVLGAVIGWEREAQGKAAGLRTHILVAVAAALFAGVTILINDDHPDDTDVLRTVNAVATGIGFLGAGLIFVNRAHSHVYGLTTAASVWATSAVGLAVGFRYAFLAACTTGMIWIVLRVLRWLPPEMAGSDDSSSGDSESADPGDHSQP